MKQINNYTLVARYIPGLISALPISFIYFFLTKRFSTYDLKDYLQTFTFAMGISITFLLSFLISMIVRELGSFLEKKYFKDRLEFPTNTIMLYEDNLLPKTTKDLYGKKISQDFHVVRYTEMREKRDRKEALKILHQASRFICAQYQQHRQVKDANIAYGFIRNLSGGLFVSIPSSLCGIIIGLLIDEKSLVLWSAVLTLCFGMFLIFHKKLMKENAEKFAYKILTVYLAE